MINFYNQVPSVYINASRDFQYLSWLINIVLNSVKHNVDDMYDLPMVKNDPRLTELLAMTLGFKVKRKYNQEQLTALVSILPSLLKCKGTKKAVAMTVEALIKSSGVIGDFNANSEQFFKLENGHLDVTLPEDLIDINLFTDLLPYIMPAGMTYRIKRKTQKIQETVTPLGYRGTLVGKWINDPDLSELFDAGTVTPEFTNIRKTIGDDGVEYSLNAGLLDNNIITSLTSTITSAKEAAYSTEENENGTTVVLNKYITEEDEQGNITTYIGGK